MQRMLGKTGIALSPVGFGCASVWGNSLISDHDAVKLFEQAYDLGITYYDTGHSYGMAEERIGKALANRFVPRAKIVLSTKFGTRIVNGKLVHDVSADWIRESVRTSLRRMGTDYIDLLSIHGTRRSDFCDEVFSTLAALKQEGLVRAIGASTSNDAGLIAEIGQNGRFDYVFIRYNLFNRHLEPLMHSLYENGIGVIAGAPLAERLYSNRVFLPRSKKDVWYLVRAVARFRKQLLQGRKYRFINHVDGMSGAQIALRYVLDNEDVSSAVVGTTSLDHLKDDLLALQKEIPADVLQKIKSI
ncbi:MAG: aldo/keto reductase [Clostridia bacterium]|nr:aldo/keto reductase [Clostridia bacterium]